MAKPSNFTKFFSTYLMQHVSAEQHGEYRFDCPFLDCLKSQHFYGNCSDGQWHCKRCDRSGNARTLITELHDQYLPLTTPSQYRSLSEVRGISPQILENAGFAYDVDHDRWLVPYYTYNIETDEWSDYLNNLGYFFPSSTNDKMRYKIRKASELPLYLYNCGLHQYPPEDTAIILEGEWDTLTYFDMFPDTTNFVLGKAGAGWKSEYAKSLSKTKRVIFLLDNDLGGRKQTALAAGKTYEYIRDIHTIDWALIPGAQKDIRDQWVEDKEQAIAKIKAAIVPYDLEEIKTQEQHGSYQTCVESHTQIETFEEYITNAQKYLYLTPEVKLSIASVLGITNSITIPGEPLWAFLIGPPSSGKTTFIDSFGGNNEYFDNLSKITAKSLISGWKDETSKEPSYLIKLKNMTLFVKDFTVTLSSSVEEQKEVFGLLTDIFDGYVKIPYGNNLVKEFYGLYFNMIAGVTDKVHAHSAATIGERFFRIDYLGATYDSREFANRALLNFGKNDEKKEKLMENTLGFVKYLRQMPISMDIDPQYHDPIIDLAEFIATIRTKVEADQREGIKYRPRAELPARLTIGLAKLFVSIRSVFNRDPDNEEETARASKIAWQCVKKVGMDTCYGFPLDIVKTIYHNPNADKDHVASLAKVQSTRAYRILNELKATGVVQEMKGFSKGGRPPNIFVLNPKLTKVLDYDTSHIEERPRRVGPPRGPRPIGKRR
jgi:hypothetical protein